LPENYRKKNLDLRVLDVIKLNCEELIREAVREGGFFVGTRAGITFPFGEVIGKRE